MFDTFMPLNQFLIEVLLRFIEFHAVLQNNTKFEQQNFTLCSILKIYGFSWLTLCEASWGDLISQDLYPGH